MLYIVFCAMLLLNFGCVTVGIKDDTAPKTSLTAFGAACSNSVVWINKSQIDFALSTAVTALKIMSIYNPPVYTAAKVSADVLINMFKKEKVSYEEILESSASKDLKVVATIVATYWKPGDVITKCDLDVLINYLEML